MQKKKKNIQKLNPYNIKEINKKDNDFNIDQKHTTIKKERNNYDTKEKIMHKSPTAFKKKKEV